LGLLVARFGPIALRLPLSSDTVRIARPSPSCFARSPHLLLDVLLEAAQHERPDDGVEALDEVVVARRVPLNDGVHGVAEPVRELLAGLEHVRHEEVQQRPELHEVVLESEEELEEL